MTRTLRNLALLIPAFSLLGACATSEHWSASGGDRQIGIVKVSYEHGDSDEPDLSATRADLMADNRCKTWGYRDAELIPGLLRSCTNAQGNRCELWKVTREYQCQNGQSTGSLATNLAR
ncbi:MAG: hypothetical protein H7Y89_08405 [Steroidobacteraceae bacterium]|nr:hypothetical protein [Steroidobacteraceae bacterium]